MFFSDELLTGKKGSLGIIWLMATLGPKNRRVNKKSLAAVEITRTCEIIAEPPEPMALRLSGHLLFGVARLYHQNHDAFERDVTNFDMVLRRSLVTDLKTGAVWPPGTSGGIDLLGGGKSKYDQITYTMLDGPEAFGAFGHFGFEPVDWENPALLSRKRRASSKLSSLPTENEQEDESEFDSDEEDGPVARKRKRTETPMFHQLSLDPQGRFATPLLVDDLLQDVDKDQEIAPFDLGILDDVGQFGFEEPGSGPSSGQVGGVDDVFGGAIDMDMGLGGDFMQPGDGEEQPDTSADAEDPDADTADAPGTKRMRDARSSSGSDIEDAEEVLSEVKTNKKKRVKKVPKVTADAAIEMEHATTQQERRAYIEAMAKRREHDNGKKETKDAANKAAAMVDGAGLWVEFADKGMSALFASISRVDKFKWQLHAGGRTPSEAPAEIEEIGEEEEVAPCAGAGAGDEQQEFDGEQLDMGEFQLDDLPQQDMPAYDFGGQDNLDYRQIVPRNKTGALPWQDSASHNGSLDLLIDVGGNTPSSRCLSNMTPQETRLRAASSKGKGKAPATSRSRTGSVVPQPWQHPHNRRSRSTSMASSMQLNDEMMPEDDYAGMDLDMAQLAHDPADAFPPDTQESGFTANPNSAFSPSMLATLERQCRDFFSYVETRMIEANTEEIELAEVLPVGAGKRVAAAAFYNTIHLATKRIFKLHQNEAYGPIAIKIASPDE